jgi:hypothetical protein
MSLVYERIVQCVIALYQTGNSERLKSLLDDLAAWSEAHRGEQTEDELAEAIDAAFARVAEAVSLSSITSAINEPEAKR